jgi:hypothetical protein
MSFRVKVLLDSISPPTKEFPDGKRLLTYRLRFPREILAEINTHTILNKNAQSSRAIPYEAHLDFVSRNPYIPQIGRDQRGMQAGESFEGDELSRLNQLWLGALHGSVAIDSEHCLLYNHFGTAAIGAEMARMGAAKQVVNRLIEPFSWTNQVLTGTEWANFFALRTDAAAHPAFRTLAQAMYVASLKSVPKQLDYGQWHLPYVGQDTTDWLLEKMLDLGEVDKSTIDLHRFTADTPFSIPVVASVVRCARTSYHVFGDNSRKYGKADIATWKKLIGGRIKHASPTGHQATPLHPAQQEAHQRYRSNLFGWLQLRKLIVGENITVFEPSQEEVDGWAKSLPADIFNDDLD